MVWTRARGVAGGVAVLVATAVRDAGRSAEEKGGRAVEFWIQVFDFGIVGV